MSFNPTQIQVTSWDKYFLEMSRFVATKSKDRSTKCGCVLVRGNRVLSTGYNGFPTGTEDYDNEEKNERPEKYLWFEHSERNAIYSAAKNGVALEGAIAYVTGPPCIDCTRGMIQSGIKTVVIPVKHNMQGRPVTKQWTETAQKCEEMMRNANVSYCCVEIDNGDE